MIGASEMRKVLVVEHSPAMRGLIGSLLEELEDMKAMEVDNGLEALPILAQENFDLIITDMNMPNLNGLELISFIRNNNNHSETPILVLSSEAAGQDRDNALVLGANAYLIKPFVNSELVETVKGLLG